MHKRTFLLYLLFFILFSVSVDGQSKLHAQVDDFVYEDTATWTGRMQRLLDSLISLPLFETTQVGMYVRDLTAGRDIFLHNSRYRLRPASNQKVVTAIAALRYLGGDYTYRTKLLLTGQVCDSILQGDIYVVGGMDPLLSQGEVYQMALALHEAGIDSLAGNICLDLTFKDRDDLGWGWCWDDDTTPLRPLMVDKKDDFVTEFLTDLNVVGIRGGSGDCVTNAECPPSARLFCEVTHTIEQVLTRMMKKSDNYYAESMFYLLGARNGQKNVTRKDGATQVERMIREVGLNPADYQIADGSGVSLYNYLSPQLLVRLLEYAWQHETIRRSLYPNLPIAGVDGTLEKRMRKTVAEGNVHAKTGTVNGVSSLSGYATSPEGHILIFSIINQGIPKAQLGRDWQDKVCVVLCGGQ